MLARACDFARLTREQAEAIRLRTEGCNLDAIAAATRRPRPQVEELLERAERRLLAAFPDEYNRAVNERRFLLEECILGNGRMPSRLQPLYNPETKERARLRSPLVTAESLCEGNWYLAAWH